MQKTFKKILKVFDFMFTSILIIALFVTFTYFIKASVSNSVFLDMFGYTPLTVVSGSMEPVIKINDIVIVKKAHYSELIEGDVIVYYDDIRQITIIHRLVAITNGKAITKGDANFSADIPFSVTQIYGKKVLTIPYVGQFVYYLKTHHIARYILISLFLICLTFFILYYKKQKKLTKI